MFLWLDACLLLLIPLAPCYTSNNLSSATSWTCNSWRGHDGQLTFAPACDAAGGLAAGYRRLYQAPTEIRHPRRTSLRALGGSTQPGAMPPNPPCLVTCQGQSPGTEIRKTPPLAFEVGGRDNKVHYTAKSLSHSLLFSLSLPECFWRELTNYFLLLAAFLYTLRSPLPHLASPYSRNATPYPFHHCRQGINLA